MSELRTRYRATFLVLAAGIGGWGVLQSLVTPVLPTLEHELHTSQSNVTWLLTGYLLSASVFTPIFGRLGDMTGKKRMFVVALGALALGSLLAATTSSLAVMITARVIQGVGGGVLPLSFGIIRDEFPSDKVPGAVGAIAALSAVGAGVGIVLSGPIVDALDYHWLFWIPLIVTCLALISAHFLIPESPVKTGGTINWQAAILLSAWLLCLLLAVSQAPVWGWASGRVLGLLAAGLVLLALWVRVESRATSPLIDMKMMKIRAVWTTNAVAMLFGFGLYSLFAFLPAFLQAPATAGYGFGSSITESGLMLLPLTITMFIFGVYTGRFAVIFGSKNVVIFGAAVSMVAFLMLAFEHQHKWEIYLAMTIMGIGFGTAFSGMSNLIVAAVPPEQTGVASGMNANIRTIGGALGAACMTSIVAASSVHGGLPKESGYTDGFAMLAAALALSGVAAMLVPKVRRNASTHREPAVALRHPDLAAVVGGTLVGDESE